MTSETAKSVSTCAIWLATAITLAFGLFRMNGDGFFIVVMTLIIGGAAVAATAIVWHAPVQTSPGKAPPDREV